MSEKNSSCEKCCIGWLCAKIKSIICCFFKDMTWARGVVLYVYIVLLGLIGLVFWYMITNDYTVIRFNSQTETITYKSGNFATWLGAIAAFCSAGFAVWAIISNNKNNKKNLRIAKEQYTENLRRAEKENKIKDFNYLIQDIYGVVDSAFFKKIEPGSSSYYSNYSDEAILQYYNNIKEETRLAKYISCEFKCSFLLINKYKYLLRKVYIDDAEDCIKKLYENCGHLEQLAGLVLLQSIKNNDKDTCTIIVENEVLSKDEKNNSYWEVLSVFIEGYTRVSADPFKNFKYIEYLNMCVDINMVEFKAITEDVPPGGTHIINTVKLKTIDDFNELWEEKEAGFRITEHDNDIFKLEKKIQNKST